MRVVALALLLLLAGVAAAWAQLPTEPISIGDGRVVLGAEVTATFAGDDPGFFNYTDYEYSSVRNFRFVLAGEARANRWLQALGELRVDHGTRVEPFAMYVRLRPWSHRRLDIQVGRLPPTFGAYWRTSYSTNLLIGVPLAYQYLTSLRRDSLPGTAEDLLDMRGRGWLSSFPLGVVDADRGLPIVNTARADHGVQVHGMNGMVEWIGAVTKGTLSNPRDDNGGVQVAGRAMVRPAYELTIGVSAARGQFLNRAVEGALPEGRDLDDGVQRALGLDLEYSEGRFLARSEVIVSRWVLPVALTSDRNEHLSATSFLVEGRYRLAPGVQVAARGERLGFSKLAVPGGVRRWEAPVDRVEIGGAYAIIRNIVVKASWQRNVRDGGRVRRESIGAMQVVYWF